MAACESRGDRENLGCASLPGSDQVRQIPAPPWLQIIVDQYTLHGNKYEDYEAMDQGCVLVLEFHKPSISVKLKSRLRRKFWLNRGQRGFQPGYEGCHAILWLLLSVSVSPKIYVNSR